jgi:hypothetical protein
MSDGRNLSEIQTSREYGQQQNPQKSVHDVNVEPAMLSDAFEQVNLLPLPDFGQKSGIESLTSSDL